MPDVGVGLAIRHTSTVIVTPLLFLAILERMTRNASFLPKEKRPVHPCNHDRNKLDRQEHTADDGVGYRRRKDKMHPKKLRFLRWRRLPRRKHEGKDQKNDHAIEHGDIELPWPRARRSKRRRTIGSDSETSPTLHAEPIDLGL